MNKLIRVEKNSINDELVETVDARQLHGALGSGKMFAHWVKAKVADNVFFQEGTDYILLAQSVKQSGSGGHNRKDYLLTAEVAEKLTIEAQSRRKVITSKGIYLLECQGFYKIGIASNVVQRVKDLQCGNPFSIKVVAFSPVKKAAKIEAELHRTYSKKRTSGEWFALSKKDALNVVKAMEAAQ